MNKTKIQWTDYSWNPIGMKCTPVSAGCKNCWHLELLNRFGLKDEGLRQKEVEAPLRLKKPSKIAVQLMGDLFHKDVPFETVDKVFAVMALCPQHTFILLTKRPDRGLEYFQETHFLMELHGSDGQWPKWPLPNVWLGVSIEDQKTADERIPILLQIPAAKRIVSYEPALGGVDFNHVTIDWLIIGCESGPKRRPCELEWVESAVEQCTSAGVPVFAKQIEINGKVEHDINKFPEHLRKQQYPKGR